MRLGIYNDNGKKVVWEKKLKIGFKTHWKNNRGAERSTMYTDA